MTKVDTDEKVYQLVGQLMRKADSNMKESEYKQGYLTALRDILGLVEDEKR